MVSPVCVELLKAARLLYPFPPLSVSSSPAECPLTSCRSGAAGDSTRVVLLRTCVRPAAVDGPFLQTSFFYINMMSCGQCTVTVRLRRTSLSLLFLLFVVPSPSSPVRLNAHSAVVAFFLLQFMSITFFLLHFTPYCHQKPCRLLVYNSMSTL